MRAWMREQFVEICAIGRRQPTDAETAPATREARELRASLRNSIERSVAFADRRPIPPRYLLQDTNDDFDAELAAARERLLRSLRRIVP